jgi:hypothetical protein
MKETIFQILNTNIWTRNKALRPSNQDLHWAPACLRCNMPESVGHFLYACDHYSARIWALLGRTLTLSLSRHMGKYSQRQNLVLFPEKKVNLKMGNT